MTKSYPDALKKRTFGRQGDNFHPIVTTHSTHSKTDYIPNNSFHSGKTHPQICRGPFMEQSHCCCGHVLETSEMFQEGRAHACEGSTTAGPRSAAARQLHQLCSQPPALPAKKARRAANFKGTRTTLSHCFKPFHKFSRFT